MKNVNLTPHMLADNDSTVAEFAEQQRLLLLSPRKWFRDTVFVSTDPKLLCTTLIEQWLHVKFPDARTLALALSSSLCFGLYRNGRQIGFARAVTDLAETWVIRDLFISPEYRFVGLGSWLLRCCISHPAASGCRRVICLSKSAHEFFDSNGFRSHPGLLGIYVAARLASAC